MFVISPRILNAKLWHIGYEQDIYICRSCYAIKEAMSKQYCANIMESAVKQHYKQHVQK